MCMCMCMSMSMSMSVYDYEYEMSMCMIMSTSMSLSIMHLMIFMRIFTIATNSFSLLLAYSFDMFNDPIPQGLPAACVLYRWRPIH